MRGPTRYSITPLLAVGRADHALSLIKVEGRTLTPLKTIPVGKGARELCLSPDGNRVYVSNDPDSTVTVIDLAAQKVITTISLPAITRLDGCAVSPNGKKLYVAGMESGNVAILSAETNQLQKTIEVGKDPLLVTPRKSPAVRRGSSLESCQRNGPCFKT